LPGKRYGFSAILSGAVAAWYVLMIAVPSLSGSMGSVFAGETGGRAWSEDKRFSDNGDGTITDTKTGLMWTREDSYQRTGHWVNWKESYDYVKNLNEAGFAHYNDWQVPTRKELQTLFEADKVNSAQVGREMKIHIDPIFAKEGAGSHWAAENNGMFNAYGVVFNHGQVFSAPKKSRARKSVRAVRHPQPERMK